MNAQTVIQKDVHINRGGRYTGFPVRNNDAKAVASSVRPVFLPELNKTLTNGDPPKLMLWGSED